MKNLVWAHALPGQFWTAVPRPRATTHRRDEGGPVVPSKRPDGSQPCGKPEGYDGDDGNGGYHRVGVMSELRDGSAYPAHISALMPIKSTHPWALLIRVLNAGVLQLHIARRTGQVGDGAQPLNASRYGAQQTRVLAQAGAETREVVDRARCAADPVKEACSLLIEFRVESNTRISQPCPDGQLPGRN